MKISKIRQFFILLAAVVWAIPAPAAKVEYSPKGVLSFSESTPWGDMTAVFKYCLANELFTFSTVNLDGRRVNAGDLSDNIGPFNADGNWVGANHLFGNGEHTAATKNLEIWADETRLNLDVDQTVDCKVLKINVTNLLRLVDDELFAWEKVTYKVAGNSIEVEVEHEYICNKTVTVVTYYGMQSMFDGEDKLLIPGTQHGGWIPVDKSVSIEIPKREAPDFHLFIESNGRAMQASYLMDEDLGTHELITDARNVFVHAGAKSYHSLMRYNEVEPGSTSRWHGVYSWFREPIKDTFGAHESNPCIVYGAYIGGEPCHITAYDDGRVVNGDEDSGIIETPAAPAMPAWYCTGSAIVVGGDNIAGVALYDLAGRMVSSTVTSTILPLDGAPSGFYILLIVTTDGKSVAAKIAL